MQVHIVVNAAECAILSVVRVCLHRQQLRNSNKTKICTFFFSLLFLLCSIDFSLSSNRFAIHRRQQGTNGKRETCTKMINTVRVANGVFVSMFPFVQFVYEWKTHFQYFQMHALRTSSLYTFAACLPHSADTNAFTDINRCQMQIILVNLSLSIAIG